MCDGDDSVSGICIGGEDTNNNGAIDSGETDPNLGSDDVLDSDGDGLTDPVEATLGTDPNDPDTDGDGLNDGQEDANGNGVVDAGETNPLDADSDDDGLSDGAEDTNGNGVVDAGETDPLNPDSDQDGLQDGTEQGVTTPIAGGSSDGGTPVSYAGTDPATFIPDADPATTTDPTNPDTDGGGLSDGNNGASSGGVCTAGEDLNNNGRVDAGETDPNRGSDDAAAVGLQLRIKALLQGAYVTTGLMRDDLRVKGVLPVQQPMPAPLMPTPARKASIPPCCRSPVMMRSSTGCWSNCGMRPAARCWPIRPR
ncbi:MAG: hypothetical protein R3E89_04940 [Thiolinea sp.]